MIIALTGHREERLNLPPDVSDSKWEHIILNIDIGQRL